MSIKSPSKKIVRHAAAAAVADLFKPDPFKPPVDGGCYPAEATFAAGFIAQKPHKPYFDAEKTSARTLGFVGLVTAFVVPAYAGWTYISIAFFFTGLAVAYMGFYQGFFRRFPTAVSHETIKSSRLLLEESAEAHQSMPSIVTDALAIVLCAADAFVTSSSAAERLGQSVLSARGAMLVGAAIGVALTAALWALLRAASRESRMADARLAISELESSNPPMAEAMKTRLGGVLKHAYGPRHNSMKMRLSLFALVVVMAATSFGMRFGSLTEADAAEKMHVQQMR